MQVFFHKVCQIYSGKNRTSDEYNLRYLVVLSQKQKRLVRDVVHFLTYFSGYMQQTQRPIVWLESTFAFGICAIEPYSFQ
jgi:hypothetical protein